LKTEWGFQSASYSWCNACYTFVECISVQTWAWDNSLKRKCTGEPSRKYYIHHEGNNYSIIDKLLSQMW